MQGHRYLSVTAVISPGANQIRHGYDGAHGQATMWSRGNLSETFCGLDWIRVKWPSLSASGPDSRTWLHADASRVDIRLDDGKLCGAESLAEDVRHSCLHPRGVVMKSEQLTCRVSYFYSGCAEVVEHSLRGHSWLAPITTD